MISNLFKRGGLQWNPDADATNAPDQTLLRADNLLPDQSGALALRRGSTPLYEGLHPTGDGDVTQLHTVELANGTKYRIAEVDRRIFIDGVDQSVTLDGDMDMAVGDDGYQIFMASGTQKKKFDGTSLMNWGITRPIGVPTLSAIASPTKSAAAFDSTESPATSADEGTSTATTDEAGTSNAARLVTPSSSTSRAVVTRLFTTDQDFFEVSGAPGSDSDLFDLWVKFEDPQRVEEVAVVFGVGNSSTLPFTTDRYEFVFDFRTTTSIPIKNPDVIGSESYYAAVQAQLLPLDPTTVTGNVTPEQVKALQQQAAKVALPVSGTRPAPNVWTHLSVPRGMFKRYGMTSASGVARNWSTVRGFQVIYKCQNGYTKTATFADAIMIGGGDRALTGTFTAVVVAARTTDTYIELSPPSVESEKINLNHDTLQVTIPAAMINNADPEVDQFWIYLFGGNLTAYYRAHISGADIASGMTLEELTTPDGGNMGDADERSRITSHGMTMQSGSDSSDIVITLSKSESGILTENKLLEAYTSGPLDNIVGIAGPWNNRMFTLTEDGYVYPSSNTSPSLFNTLQVIDLTKYGDPLWIVRCTAGILVGMEKDVIFLAGSGDDQLDLTIDLYPQPINVGNPPSDSMVAVDGNTVIYRSADGPIVLAGTSLSALPTAGTSLIWRGQDRHGVQGLNVELGRFRAAIDNMMLYMLAPEGDDTSGNVIYRYSFPHQQWSRLTYPQVGAFLSIRKEPDGTLVAGDDAGNIWQLDEGDQDNGNNIPIVMLTPIADGGNPLAYKDAFDLQLHCNTGGLTGTAELLIDGETDSSLEEDFSATTNTVFRIQANGIGRFLKAQLRLTGDFDQFSLQQYNLTYRARPEHTTYLDSGYILPAEPGDVIWAQEVEFDANCASDFTMEFYHDDVLKYSVDVDASATLDTRTTYVMPLPRGSQAKRPRVVFKTQATNAEGAIGFDCYGIRLRVASSGNQNGSPYMSIYPAGQAS